MATTKFTANGNTTVTIQGITPTITVGELPEGLTLMLNEVVLETGQTVTLSENMTLTASLSITPSGTITIGATNYNSVLYDGAVAQLDAPITVSEGNHTLNFTGATAIPTVSINGSAIESLTVNGVEIGDDTIPYTFTPVGGRDNSVYVTGVGNNTYELQLTGTNIRNANVNGQSVTLPYKTQVNNDKIVTVDGEVFQVDIQSIGAKITQNDSVISNGEEFHKIIDITGDTYFNIDATHILTINGTNLKSLTVNGVTTPITSLPYTVRNTAMSVDVELTALPPSTVYVSGEYIKSATLNGESLEIGANGQVGLSFTTLDEKQYLTIIGTQPRKYGITWNDNGSTNLYLNGKLVASGSTSLIDSDVYVAAEATPIPLIFDTDEATIIEINGKPFREEDFTVTVNTATQIDVNSTTCRVTIDYGDNSYKVLLPRKLVTLTAPHRNGWVFDTWSSQDVGIQSPKMVQTLVNLEGITEAHIVAHYQQYLTHDKPNFWN